MYVKTQLEATHAGAALKKLMKRGRWKVHVWNNLGWYYEIQAGNLRVLPASNLRMGGQRYYCLISRALALMTDDREYLDPNMAVTRAVSKVRKVVAEYQQVVDEATQAAGSE